MLAHAIVARASHPEQGLRREAKPEPASAGSADRMGIRVARAAGKRQARGGSKRRGATSSRAAPSRAKRRPAKRRRSEPARRAKPAAKPARKTAARRTTARRKARPQAATARRSTARRAASATPAKRSTAKRAPAKRARAAAAAKPQPAFAVQRAGATSREQLLFEMARARATVKAAIQGLTAYHAMQPIAPGKWSCLEIVLHLSERDRVRLEEFGRTLAGLPRSWAGIADPAMAAVNEAHLAPLRAHTWDEAIRRLDSLREELLLRISEVPALPDDVWQRGHAFGDMLWGLPEHDRHHAEQIKRARVGASATLAAAEERHV